MAEPHWLTGETVDENTQPWIMGMNRSYFLLGVKSFGIFLLIFSVIFS